MIRKLIFAILLTLCVTPTPAQNIQCPNRPFGDTSNACANTRFVQDALIPLFANPSALVGPTAVNGIDNHAMRADAAPAFNSAADYTQTGNWTFTKTIDAAAIQIGPTTNTLLSGLGNTPSLGVGVVANLYPSNASASPDHYDPHSNVLTNTLGAKSTLIGAAAINGVTWANTYIPGIDGAGVVTNYTLSTDGQQGSFTGSRTSDNDLAGSGSTGLTVLTVNDSANGLSSNGQYTAGYITSTSFLNHQNAESSVINNAMDAGIEDPYTKNPAHFVDVFRLDCGDGGTFPATIYTCSSALHVVNNGQRFGGALIVDNDSVIVNSSYAPAIQLPQQYGMSWFGAAGVETWRIFSAASSSAALGQIILADNAIEVFLGAGSFEPFQITETGISAQWKVNIASTSAGTQAVLNFFDTTTTKWQIGKLADNSFIIFDVAGGFGDIALAPSSANPVSIRVGGASENITAAAANSGGAGFRMLVVPN